MEMYVAFFVYPPVHLFGINQSTIRPSKNVIVASGNSLSQEGYE